ncbi:hypothetical protein F2P56_018951, partial [Juglans regia]
THQVEEKHVYSVWAVPPDNVAAMLKKLLEDLQSEFGGPQFEPHITVFGAISLTSDNELSRFRSACNGLKPTLPPLIVWPRGPSSVNLWKLKVLFTYGLVLFLNFLKVWIRFCKENKGNFCIFSFVVFAWLLADEKPSSAICVFVFLFFWVFVREFYFVWLVMEGRINLACLNLGLKTSFGSN